MFGSLRKRATSQKREKGRKREEERTRQEKENTNKEIKKKQRKKASKQALSYMRNHRKSTFHDKWAFLICITKLSHVDDRQFWYTVSLTQYFWNTLVIRKEKRRQHDISRKFKPTQSYICLSNKHHCILIPSPNAKLGLFGKRRTFHVRFRSTEQLCVFTESKCNNKIGKPVSYYQVYFFKNSRLAMPVNFPSWTKQNTYYKRVISLVIFTYLNSLINFRVIQFLGLV